MDDFKKKLTDFLRASSLKDEEKNVWFAFISNLDQEAAASIFEAATNNPGALSVLSANLLKKIEALKTSDSAIWDKTIKQEKKFLE